MSTSMQVIASLGFATTYAIRSAQMIVAAFKAILLVLLGINQVVVCRALGCGEVEMQSAYIELLMRPKAFSLLAVAKVC